ncbi:MAG: S8 family serine peptidase, partial [Anaerolineae bacterium]
MTQPAFPWRKAVLLVLLLLGAAVRGEPLHAQEGGARKAILYAGDEVGRAALLAREAQLIADYGTFSLWQVPAGGAIDLSAAGLATHPELDQLLLREATLDTRSAELGAASTVSEGEQFYLVQFAGPVRDEWLADLRSTGAQVVAYVPYDGYVVWGDENVRAQIAARVTSRVEYQWHGAYLAAYRLAGSLHCMATGVTDPSCDPLDRADTADVVVQIWDHAGAGQTVSEVLAQAEAVLREPYAALGYRYLTVRLPAAALAPLAARADVLNVESYQAPAMLDERQGQIMAGHLAGGGTVPSGPGYLDWIASTIGFPQQRDAYPIVDVIDDGSTDHLDFYQAPPFAFRSRLRYERNLTSDPSPRSLGGHGPINLSIVGGYPANPDAGRDGAGYQYGLGISPFGSLASTKVFNDEGSWDYAGSYADLIAGSYRAGARISSNSWGIPGDTYTVADQQFDALTRDADPETLGNQAMLHVFAAGNQPDQLSYPGSAKNVIGVGASENVRPDSTDGCGFGPTEADNAQDMASFSSRGPTADGRAKPDVVAPGTHVQGAASQEAGYAGWNPLGVCNRYWPAGQTLYTWSSGTSHAAPAVAGALSLIQVYLDQGMGGELLPAPSPAMLKAYLLNSGRRLVGDGTGGAYASLPSAAQGWGLVDLGRAFDGVPRLLVDQDVLIDHSGQQVTFTGLVANTAKPLRVTLAWTDAPGTPSAAPWVNDLDLEVVAGGQIYRGNVFFGSTSIPGTGYEFDRRNNVEAVYIPAGVNGPLTVRVTGYNIAGDGVPGNGDPTDQDFALVIYNGTRNFELSAAPPLGQVCGADTFTYTVSAGAMPAYGGTISLTHSTPPLGGGITLAPSTGTPPFDASLQVTASDTTPPGHYTVTVTSAGVPARAISVGLDVDTSAPTGPPALLSPSDASSDVALRPTLSWQAVPGVRAYQLELSGDAAFSSLAL